MVFSCRSAIHYTAYFPWDTNAEKAHINMIKNESLASHCIASKLAIFMLFLDFEALSYLTENNITNHWDCAHVSWVGSPQIVFHVNLSCSPEKWMKIQLRMI